MLGRLLLLFILVPLVELAILVQLGRVVGLWPTLGIVVATGIGGAALARREGLRTLRAFQREVAEGRIPGRPLFDGLAVLVGGAFLLTPGIVTDVAGFVLLAPPTRALLRRWARKTLRRAIQAGTVSFTVRAARRAPWGPEPGEGRGPGGGGGPGGEGRDAGRAADADAGAGDRLPPT